MKKNSIKKYRNELNLSLDSKGIHVLQKFISIIKN